MGGFVLVDGDDEVEVLSPNGFDDLFATRRVGLPWITEKDIQDRSKGDALSKGLVVTQTLWFIAQCVSRRVQNLAYHFLSNIFMDPDINTIEDFSCKRAKDLAVPFLRYALIE